MARQKKLLEERYDLSVKVSDKVKMSRGKPIPVGPATRLPAGTTWETWPRLSPDEIRDKGLFPKGFLPLPHPHHEVGRHGLPADGDQAAAAARAVRPRLRPARPLPARVPAGHLPDHPPRPRRRLAGEGGDRRELPGDLPAASSTPRTWRACGSWSRSSRSSSSTPRPTARPTGPTACSGVACFDCHVNGHTSAATHLVGDIRPQSHRRRIDTPSLRGVNIQRLFGSQRALKIDRGLHRVRAAGGLLRRRPGVGRRPRGSTRWSAAARSTSWPRSRTCSTSRRPPAWGSTASSTRGSSPPTRPRCAARTLFFGKAQCATCHPAPYYTDNTMHDLQVDRFYKTADDQRPGRHQAGADQDVPAARHQGVAAVLPRRPAAHAGGHRGVLQPRPGAEALQG